MTDPVHAAIYGVGNFGYALLKHLDQQHGTRAVRVRAYDRSSELLSHLEKHRRHLYLHTDQTLSPRVRFAHTAQELLADCEVLILCVSSDATRQVLSEVRDHLPSRVVVLNTAKALDRSTGSRLSDVVAQELEGVSYRYAAVAGGTIASDLFHSQPLGVDVASTEPEALAQVQDLLTSGNLAVYGTSDLVGLEYASALKNVLAIFAGIVQGLGFSYGSETHVISRLAHAIGQVCVEQLGASPDTFGVGSQCWGNDMWMSCTGDSRNHQFGVLVGQLGDVGEALAVMEERRATVEGLNTINVLDTLPALLAIPALDLLQRVVTGRSAPVSALGELLVRRRPDVALL